jgi:hypothetical protein
MKAIFGVLSLLIVLAIVGGVAKKQLSASGLSGRAASAERTASLPADRAMPAAATVPEQSQALQQQARDRTMRALQQGVERNNRADP